jgi:hypothetical protein
VKRVASPAKPFDTTSFTFLASSAFKARSASDFTRQVLVRKYRGVEDKRCGDRGDPAQLSRFESGQMLPTIPRLRQLGALYGVTSWKILQLMEREADENS